MENDIKLLGKTLIDLNLILTNQIEGFNFETKHKNVSVDTEFKILHLLENYGRLTPGELVNKLFIAKSNLSNQCKDMMNKGLIKQFSDKNDKRVVCYGLCQRGKEKYEETLVEVIKNFNEAINPNNFEDIKRHIIELSLLIN